MYEGLVKKPSAKRLFYAKIKRIGCHFAIPFKNHQKPGGAGSRGAHSPLPGFHAFKRENQCKITDFALCAKFAL